MNYNEALEYIHSVCWKGSRPGLERITELCALLGNPEKKLEFIHIAGTNGKGSTSAMLTSILMAAGKKVGTFTSPYIFDFRERMCVNGEMISKEMLASVTEYVKPFADSMKDSPTEFELISAIAFVYFLREECDVVVLEAGLGGRLDSTNVIEKALCSVITGIALDHTEFLGDTTEKIAREKAGIIKSGCPVVVGKVDEGAERAIRSVAAERNSSFVSANAEKLENVKCIVSGSTFDYSGIKNIHLPLIGAFQPYNASVAISVSRVLGISDEIIKSGLSKVRWRGRFEILGDSPTVIYDGGHNIQCAEAIAETLDELKIDKVVMLTAVMADKAYNVMTEILSPYIKAVYCVSLENNPRALSGEEYARVYSELGVESYSAPSVENGLGLAYELAKKEKLPLFVTGSLYLYREFVDALEKIKA